VTAHGAALLPYSDEPFAGDAASVTLVLEASRPKSEWSTTHDFPTALREGRTLMAFKDNMEHAAMDTDQARVDFLQAQIDRLSAFIAGVR
jgi:hypothetical protein